MNGEVNGTMEKPKDDSVPNPSVDLQNQKNVATEGCDDTTDLCENSNYTEDSNHLDTENSQECTSSSNAENLENDNSNGSENQIHDIQLSPKIPENENSNSIVLASNSGNSNESYPESVTSLQTLSDSIDPPVMHIIDDEKNKEGEPPRLVAKGTTRITCITEITNDETNSGNSNESCSEFIASSQTNSDSTNQLLIYIDDKSMEGPTKLYTIGSDRVSRVNKYIGDENNRGKIESMVSSQANFDSPEQPMMHIIDDASIGEPPRLIPKGPTRITEISTDESYRGNIESVACSKAKFDSAKQPVVHIIDNTSIGEPPRLTPKSSNRITQISNDEIYCGRMESVPSTRSKFDSPEQPMMHIIDNINIGEPPKLTPKSSTCITQISKDEINRGKIVPLPGSQAKFDSPEQPLIHIIDDTNIGEPPRLTPKSMTRITQISKNERIMETVASSQNNFDSPEQPVMHIIDDASIGEPPRLFPKGSNRITQISKDESNGNSSESYTMISSPQGKCDSPEQPVMHIIDEKSIGEPPRLFSKGTTRITQIIKDENSETDSEDTSSSVQDIFISPPGPEDTVSINSDDSDLEGIDLAQNEIIKIGNSNIILLENDGSLSQNGNSNEFPSSDVQEIISDNEDCVVADENEADRKIKEKDTTNVSDNKVQLRRSSRAIKRKRYNDDIENGGHESDLEEVAIGPSFNRKNKPIVINDTKVLVEMAARQMKSHQSHSQKKEPTVVIIDTNSSGSEKSSLSHKPSGLTISSSLNAQSLYQSIVARGTTVTPISSKSSVATQSATQNLSKSFSQAAQTAQPLILPSLTDDMFVVEAPSFIVPYVYEKPSVKPFREFVDLMGKELDEQRAKELKESKEKLRKQKDQKENQDTKVKGEEVEESEEDGEVMMVASSPLTATNEADSNESVESKKKKKKEKRRRGEDDDASWDGDTSTDSEDEIVMSDDENKTIIIKDKADSIEDIKDVSELTVDKVCSNKADNYFDCSIGKFFINIGLSLVQEYVQTDLLKQQNRKLYREKKTGHSTKSTESSISSLMKNIKYSKLKNAPYSFTQKKCEFCSFKTESKLAMGHHLETPHMKNNVYKCNFCPFEIRSPHDILYHMEAEHNIRGKLERAPAYHQCANCPFEDNGKGKLARHLIPCAKKFKPELNLAPPLEWEPPAKIPKIARSRNNMMSSYHNSYNRSQLGSNLGRPAMNVPSIMPGMSSSYRPRNRTPMTVPSRAIPVLGTPILRGGVIVRHNSPAMSSNYPVANNVKKSVHQPSISITPLPRQPLPVPVLPQPSHNSKSTFVICEICDGYIKDLEQLRNHMQWIHKVKIHPKMIYNRPPLNCQKCQFRFFTDQGLERHLLGSHGLVTSAMQEAANKGKDAGRCPVCGRVYQWKLLNHVARDHNLTLKPAHLSYKCTVCTATFGMYKQFLNHVYSAHSVVAKRVMDKSKSSAPKTNSESLLKPLKINDEITIIPQPVKSAPGQADDAD